MQTPPCVEAVGITKSFAGVRVLDAVDFSVNPATFHALVGENGAGKSTLVKCMLGFYHPEAGSVRIRGEPVATPADTRRAGMGMVFQHFTLAPSMTVRENLVLARPDLPAILNWREEDARIRRFLEHAPFGVDLDSRVQHLAAGQKQKVEILKQLYLETRVLILDEPTSVLTPAEAEEVLGVLRSLVERGRLSVVLITHKLGEVMAFADEVTVLRRGRSAGYSRVADTNSGRLAAQMIGNTVPPQPVDKVSAGAGRVALELKDLTVDGDTGLAAVKKVSLTLRTGEILGIAGVSGNGQREFVQAIGGQRPIAGGSIHVWGDPYQPTREGIRSTGLYTLPEEPLQNATVPGMSVAYNLALRTFDRPPLARAGSLLDRRAIWNAAQESIRRFSIRAPSPGTPIRNLSGGNVQRTVLARDLGTGETRILVAANPCFGLDFAAAAFVHNQLLELRNRLGAVLLVSEDLDELIEFADRIVVMSSGTIVHETLRGSLDIALIGRYMGGHAA